MLDDLRRAFRMESPTPRLNENNLRKFSKGFRSSKKSRASVGGRGVAASDAESCLTDDSCLNGGRSASLSTLLTPSTMGRRPREDKLQTVEAKMAGIEVSLGWRKRREVMLETLPKAARELVRELDALQQSVKDRDSTIQSLRTQITNLGGSVKIGPMVEGSRVSSPAGVGPMAGTPDSSSGSTCTLVSSPEKLRVQERISRVQQEIEAKKVAVKNLRLSLEKTDLTDNIDTRIRAAEMEYELEREELNILNLKEEVAMLQTKLHECDPRPPCHPGTPGSIGLRTPCSSPPPPPLPANPPPPLRNHPPSHPSSSPLTKTPTAEEASLRRLLQQCIPLSSTQPSDTQSNLCSSFTIVKTTVQYSPANPAFRVTCEEPHNNMNVSPCVTWATDDTGLKKEDRLIEVNGRSVLGHTSDHLLKMFASNSILDLVVLRMITAGLSLSTTTPLRRLERQLEERCRDIKELQTKLEKTSKEKEDLKGHTTRLSHRISYLEEYISELQTTAKKLPKDGSQSTPTSTPSPAPSTSSSPGATVIQVFQKGPQTMAVAGPRTDVKMERSRKYPTLNCTSRNQNESTLHPSRRNSTSSSNKGNSYTASCESSSSGYASYQSVRSATSQGHNWEKDQRDSDNRLLPSRRPSSSVEHRRPKKVISATPEPSYEGDSRCSSRNGTKPMPPKKPERLSLQRAASLLSIDQVSACSSLSLMHRDNIIPEHKLRNSQLWKSTGDGLNDSKNYSDTLSSYSSTSTTSSRRHTKRRLDMVSRRESSPLPKSTEHHRGDCLYQATSPPPLPPTSPPSELRDENCSPEIDDLNTTLKEDENYHNVPNRHAEEVSLCSRKIFMTSQDFPSDNYKNSSNTNANECSSKSSSKFREPSKSRYSYQGNYNRETRVPSYENLNSSGSFTDNYTADHRRMLNASSASSPSKYSSSPSRTLNSTSKIRNTEIPTDISLVHAEPMYGYLHYKSLDRTPSPSKSSGQTLSYKHNLQKYKNQSNRSTPTPSNQSLPSVSPSHPTADSSSPNYDYRGNLNENRSVNETNTKYCAGISSGRSVSREGENIYSSSHNYNSPTYQSFSSLKRQSRTQNGSGGNGNDCRGMVGAPSTPVTIRSNSTVMKIQDSQSAEDEWC